MSIIASFIAISTVGIQSCPNPNTFNTTPSQFNEVGPPNTFNPNDIKGSTWVGTWKDRQGQYIIQLAISKDGTSGKWLSRSQMGTLEVKGSDSPLVIAKNTKGQIVFQCQLKMLTGDTGQVLTNVGTSKEGNSYDEIWLERQEGSALSSD